MKSAIATALRTAADVLFPPRCAHCGADGSLFCEKCESASTRLSTDETCRTCALPSQTSVCEACFAVPPRLDRAIAMFTYQPEIQDAIAALKYKDIRVIAPRLGSLLAQALPPSVSATVDIVVPVPITRSRMRSRGYNQAELLAREVAYEAGIPVNSDLLTRNRDAVPQARTSSIEERAENVRDAFTANANADGKRVLLIDDVMTTGATLNACASALKASGASYVAALVLARELL